MKEETKVKVFEDTKEETVNEVPKETEAALEEEVQNEDIIVIDNNITTENAVKMIKRGAGILKLRKPIDINGEKRDRVYFDLKKASPRKINEVTRKAQLAAGGQMVGDPMDDMEVQGRIFSIAANIPAPTVYEMDSRDYNVVCGIIRRFFLA